MDSKVVNREIRKLVRPLLREVGFSDFTSRSSWRHWEEGVDVITFQSFNSYLADGVGCTTFSYAARLGVLLNYLPHDNYVNMRRPHEAACDLRPRLHKGVPQPLFHPYGHKLHSDRPDVWYVLADGSNLDECMEDTRQQLLSDALPYFDMVHRPEGALEALLPPYRERLIEGEVVGSPAYELRIGFVLLRLGRTHEAREHLEVVLRSGSYESLKPSIVQAIREDA